MLGKMIAAPSAEIHLLLYLLPCSAHAIMFDQADLHVSYIEKAELQDMWLDTATLIRCSQSQDPRDHAAAFAAPDELASACQVDFKAESPLIYLGGRPRNTERDIASASRKSQDLPSLDTSTSWTASILTYEIVPREIR